MSRKNLKEIKKQLPTVDNVCPIRFDRLSWLKTYQDTDNSDWEATMIPYNAISFLYDTIAPAMNMTEEETLNTKFKIITITRDYFEWLDENGLKNTPDARSEYASTISVEKANELAREAGMDIFSDVYMVPYVYTTEFGPIESLEETVRINLVNQLKEAYDIDVYMPGMVCDASAMDKIDMGQFYSDMIDMNMVDFPDQTGAIPSIKINNLNVYVGFIPFTAIYHLPSMELSLYEYLELVDDDYFNISAKTWKLYSKDVKDVVVNKDRGILKVLPYVIDLEDAADAYVEIMEVQVEMLKQSLVELQREYEAQKTR